MPFSPSPLTMMARALRAGYSMSGRHRDAVGERAEAGQARVRGDFQAAESGHASARRAAATSGSPSFPDLRVLVTAILVQKDTGGNLAEILDRTSYVIRERLRIQGEIAYIPPRAG